MKKEFFELCKKNDRGLRIALGETKRAASPFLLHKLTLIAIIKIDFSKKGWKNG